MSRHLSLSRSDLTAQVDNDDYEAVNQFRWYLVRRANTRYATTSFVVDGKRCRTRLHRLILRLNDPKIEVDHLNGDGLDCRRANLRTCTRGQNALNRLKWKPSLASGFKGVHTRGGHWIAVIAIAKHQTVLGVFDTEEAAARAYDAAARQHHGDFARFNFPADGERSAHALPHTDFPSLRKNS